MHRLVRKAKEERMSHLEVRTGRRGWGQGVLCLGSAAISLYVQATAWCGEAAA